SFFGNSIVNGGKQNTHHGGHFDSGDNNVYVTPNETGFIYPAIITKSFKNRIKATPNIFQFAKIPTNVTVYPYPHNGCWNESDRLFGTAAILINKFKFDQFNASLGPLKKVNVIMIGFGGKDAMYGQYQEAAYIGGKKNDLVICYGGGSKQESAQWAYVFSWSEKDIVKRNIETILLNNPINDDILPLIGNEIKKNYIK